MKNGLKIGRAIFTRREIDIMSCLLNNRGNKKIGILLNISHKTVEAHNRNITQKIGCNSRDCVRDYIYKCKKNTVLYRHYFDNILAKDND